MVRISARGHFTFFIMINVISFVHSTPSPLHHPRNPRPTTSPNPKILDFQIQQKKPPAHPHLAHQSIPISSKSTLSASKTLPSPWRCKHHAFFYDLTLRSMSPYFLYQNHNILPFLLRSLFFQTLRQESTLLSKQTAGTMTFGARIPAAVGKFGVSYNWSVLVLENLCER